MKMVQLVRFYWNRKKLLDICKYHITQYESKNPRVTTPSCKCYLIQEIKHRIDIDKVNVAKLNHGTNWLELANANLASSAFDLLASGRFHIYYGEINPLGCSGNLLTVYELAMKWAVNNHLITPKDYDEQVKCLFERISDVG